ncbi:hypothetical protein LY56_01025 [Roseinatronobacter thiooxidans]|uniref:Uncharacterized protein n=1 Tax=Roseinatronobacter thiooxidans TaxID=121821 RepID=A0A2W7QHM9_9RHOB|nr:DUF6544 family protein [Roseinatronobacter thiooxidans]PZX46816.1 hypothetical protein LY56_01025 [Roseinatronobacter thiooxidans]
MTIFKIILVVLAALLVAAVVLGLWVHSRDQAKSAQVWAALEAVRETDPAPYDPAMVADLPEVAQRYFARAIAPGTPLHRVVRLEMAGSFIMNGNEMAMTARQILAPPAQGFVWQAEVGQGLMRFAGSDGYHAPTGGSVDSWTKFWLRGLIPLARIGGTADHESAAATRVMLESIWAPASLLPQYGAEWVQTGPDSAVVRFAGVQGIEPMQITLDAAGNPLDVWALRWTDANAKRVHRLQPFGGRMLEMTRYQGFLIPSRVELGNMWGMHDYAPFFLAHITKAEF